MTAPKRKRPKKITAKNAPPRPVGVILDLTGTQTRTASTAAVFAKPSPLSAVRYQVAKGLLAIARTLRVFAYRIAS